MGDAVWMVLSIGVALLVDFSRTWFFASRWHNGWAENCSVLTMLTERNLNPKAACLKRREEEKGTEFLTAQSSSVYADRSAAPLVVSVSTRFSSVQMLLHCP